MKLALLILAIILFILAGLAVVPTFDFLAWGLVAFAASFLPLPN